MATQRLTTWDLFHSFAVRASSSFIVLFALAASPLYAAFGVVDDFESHTVGNSIDGVNGWSLTNGLSTVELDPTNPLNQVLSAHQLVTGGAAINAYKSLSLPNADTGTLFFRVRANDPTTVDTATDISLGMSDVAAPGGFGDFEPQFAFVNVQSGSIIQGEFRARDAGGNKVDASFDDSTWFNVWMVIDNSTDLYKAFIQGGSFGAQTQVDVAGETSFSFRNAGGDGVNSNTTPGANDLLSFFIRSGGSHRGPLYVDDIYFDPAGRNLSLPPGVIPEPSSVALASLAGLLMLGWRRRQANR